VFYRRRKRLRDKCEQVAVNCPNPASILVNQRKREPRPIPKCRRAT